MAVSATKIITSMDELADLPLGTTAVDRDGVAMHKTGQSTWTTPDLNFGTGPALIGEDEMAGAYDEKGVSRFFPLTATLPDQARASCEDCGANTPAGVRFCACCAGLHTAPNGRDLNRLSREYHSGS